MQRNSRKVMRRNQMIAYKLLRVRKDGTIGPLFINRKQRIPMGKWLKAESHRTNGYAFRPGWHCTHKPFAPHLTLKDRTWYEVKIKGYTEFTRPWNQGGLWFLAQKMKLVRKLDKDEVLTYSPHDKSWGVLG